MPVIAGALPLLLRKHYGGAHEPAPARRIHPGVRRRDGGVPDRGSDHRGRPRAVDLGHLRGGPGRHPRRQGRLGRLRLLPPVRGGPRPGRRAWAPGGTASRSPGRGSSPRAPAGSRRAASTTTTGWSTRPWPAASRRPRTLYHWDLPQALEDRGGWQERGTAEAFADYAMVVHERLGDRVGVWATHNEPWCAAYLGYSAGIHAPGRKEGAAGHRAAHHLNLGHGLAAARLHEAGVTDLGIVHNLAPFWPETPEAAQAADELDAVRNRIWLGPLVDGAYDEGLLRVAPVLADPELVRDGDLALVQGSADWIGVNYYTPFRPTLADPSVTVHPEVEAYPGVTPVSFVVREPRTDIGWEVDARGLEELLVDTHQRTGLPLMVTENGAAYPDTLARRPGPDRLPARPHRRDRAGPRGRRGRPRLPRLDAARQLRVGRGLHEDVRRRPRRPRGPDPDAEGVLPLARRAHRFRRPEPGSLALSPSRCRRAGRARRSAAATGTRSAARPATRTRRPRAGTSPARGCRRARRAAPSAA